MQPQRTYRVPSRCVSIAAMEVSVILTHQSPRCDQSAPAVEFSLASTACGAVDMRMLARFCLVNVGLPRHDN